MTLAAQPNAYIGRFAPSPTGPLHFGSLLAAVASYLDAIRHGGQWLLRIEDVDTPRSVQGMVEQQIKTLSLYGFKCDATIVRQSQRSAVYQQALDRLIAAGLAYPCTCTRTQIAAAGNVRSGIDGYVYPGTCAHWMPGDPVPEKAAWRFRVGTETQPSVAFSDRIQGQQQQQLAQEVGDFVIKRADGCYTYQLAVVVDDLAQQVTQIVRGADLLDSTARQIALLKALDGRVPGYAHIPVATNEHLEKLSKQTRAKGLPVSDERVRVRTLLTALDFLGQQPPEESLAATQAEVWQWAKGAWSLARIPAIRCAPTPAWAEP